MSRCLSLFFACFALLLPAAAQVFQPVTCSNAFTREQEITEGDKVVAQVYQQMPVLPDSDPVSRYVQQLGSRLASVAPPTPGLQQPWPFRFHVVASSEINAFALPGGTMFVNLGAIQAAETEAQLTGVMGHEMSHVILRHSTCNITAERKKSLYYGLGSIASAVLLGNSTAGALAQKGLGMGQSLDFLHMSRGDEQQADLLGVQISNNAGFDPRGLPQFFEIIQAKYGSGGAQFLSDHPNPGNRTQYVTAEIAQLDVPERPIVSTDAFRAAHAQSAKLPVYDAKQMQAGAWRSTGLYTAAPGAAPGVIPPPPAQPTGGTTATSTAPTSAPQPPAPAQPASPTTIAPIPASRLGLADKLTPYRAAQWTMQMPRSWSATTAPTGETTLAPQGANGGFGLAYGVYASSARGDSQSPINDSTLPAATDALVQTLARQNGLSAQGPASSLQIAGHAAQVVELSGQSPVAYNGAQLNEFDWLLTVARNDGTLNYFLFVCPQRDATTFRPLFNRMVNSLQLR